jgi:hypothetical protein
MHDVADTEVDITDIQSRAENLIVAQDVADGVTA